MTHMLRRSAVLLPAIGLMLLAATELAHAQDLHPSRRPSPIGIARGHVGDTYVKVTYGRPYMRGRVIFGASNGASSPLVPYGGIWRTGANEATELTVTGPIMFGGQRLAAGTYSLFTTPGPTTWRIHVSPQIGLDGTARLAADGTVTPNVYDPARDVLEIDVPSSSLAEDVDQLTMNVETGAAGAALVLRWERTEVRIPLAPAGR